MAWVRQMGSSAGSRKWIVMPVRKKERKIREGERGRERQRERESEREITCRC